MKKLFDKEAAKRFWNNIKKLFLRKPQNEGAAGKYLKYVSEDATEWADFPAFLTYKGTTPTETTLRKIQATKGDVYTVVETKAEWFYDGSDWEYIGDLVGGEFVQKAGDTMTGMLMMKFINDKGIENRINIQGNSIDVYHDGNTASAVKIKRDQFTLADKDGNIVFKVKMTGGKDIQIGKGAGNNQIVVGSKLSVSTPEAGAFAFGDTNEIGNNGEHSGVFGGNNTINDKNSLCGGDHNTVNMAVGRGDGSVIVIGSQNNVSSAKSAIFGSQNTVTQLQESERTYNQQVYGDDGYGGISNSKGSLVAGYAHRVHGNNSFVSGSNNLVIGRNSHAEGFSNKVYGASAHVEGDSNIAVNNNTHAEGDTTQAIGEGSHSEGRDTIALGEFSHAQGDESKAAGEGSFASGFGSEAIGNYSSALGMHAKTPDLKGSFACGMYNSTTNEPYFSVGNGWTDDGRENLFEVGVNAGTIINTNVSINGSTNISGLTAIPNFQCLHTVNNFTPGITNVKEGLCYKYKVNTDDIDIKIETPSSQTYSKTIFIFENGVSKDTTKHIYFKQGNTSLADITISGVGSTAALGLAKSKKVTIENLAGNLRFLEEEYIIRAEIVGV